MILELSVEPWSRTLHLGALDSWKAGVRDCVRVASEGKCITRSSVKSIHVLMSLLEASLYKELESLETSGVLEASLYKKSTKWPSGF